MGTCKTCRWWEDKWRDGVQGECSHQMVGRFDEYPVANGVRLAGCDSCSYASKLFTGPDFGCCHWELSPNVLVTVGSDGKLVVSQIVGTHDGRTVTNNAGEIA